jgi:hypothetical protein
MKPAKTTTSVNLRRGPARQYASLDELEPGYPLIVHSKVNGWWRVTAKAKGARLKDQDGYIDSRFVELVPVIIADEPIPDFHDCLLRPPEWLWVIGSVAMCALVIALIYLI